MNLIIFFRIILEISLAYVLICGINKTMKQLKLKLFILGLLVATPVFLLAQINIQINSFNQYYFNTKECLNFSAINLGLKSVEVQFNVKIDNADNSKIVEFKTSPVILNPGVNLINSMTVGIKDINYFNKDIYEIETKTGTFPSRNYKVCIWSVCSLPDCAGLGSGAGSTEQAECIQIQVENPTPLLLSYPENNSEIEEIRPVYNWIPPAPIASSSELNYLMRLVEVNEGQTPSDALMLNRPLIEIEGLVQNALMHPNDVNPLELGKTYAWQVQAFIGKTYFAKSEQWNFKIKKETIVKDTIKYAKVTGKIDAGEHKISEDGYFYFAFQDSKPNYILECNLLNSEMKQLPNAIFEQGKFDTTLRKEVFSTDITFAGEKKYRLNTASIKLSTGVYFLEIVNSRREKLYIKFTKD